MSRLRLVLAAAVLLGGAGGQARSQARATLSREEFTHRLVAAAIERTHHSVRYVSEYIRIPYPGGDVPADVGQIEADGLFSDAPGIAVGVYVADCIPVLMADERTRQLAGAEGEG